MLTRDWMRQQPNESVVNAYYQGNIAELDWQWYVAAWNARYDAGRGLTRMTLAGSLYVPAEDN